MLLKPPLCALLLRRRLSAAAPHPARSWVKWAFVGGVCTCLGVASATVGQSASGRWRQTWLPTEQEEWMSARLLESINEKEAGLVVGKKEPTYKRVSGIVTRIAERNGLDEGSLSVMVVQSEQSKLHILPNGRLVLYTGALDVLDTTEKLALALAWGSSSSLLRCSSESVALLWEWFILKFLEWTKADVVRQQQALEACLDTLSALHNTGPSLCEVDEWALHLLAQAGFDPAQFCGIFEGLCQHKATPSSLQLTEGSVDRSFAVSNMRPRLDQLAAEQAWNRSQQLEPSALAKYELDLLASLADSSDEVVQLLAFRSLAKMSAGARGINWRPVCETSFTVAAESSNSEVQTLALRTLCNLAQYAGHFGWFSGDYERRMLGCLRGSAITGEGRTLCCEAVEVLTKRRDEIRQGREQRGKREREHRELQEAIMKLRSDRLKQKQQQIRKSSRFKSFLQWSSPFRRANEAALEKKAEAQYAEEESKLAQSRAISASIALAANIDTGAELEVPGTELGESNPNEQGTLQGNNTTAE